jgi:hypothetical protein
MQAFKSVDRKTAALTATVLSLGLSWAGQASAGCSVPARTADQAAQPFFSLRSDSDPVYQGRARLTAGLMKVGYTVDDDDDWAWGPRPTAIVGLWKVSLVSKGSKGIPDGAVIDAGYVTWHADGTELMNSGRPPITGSFCMGVWKQVGKSTFKLNHIALAWDPTGTAFVGPARIREIVTVDHDRDSYAGTFTLDQYSTDEKTLLAHVQGTVSAKRVTAD